MRDLSRHHEQLTSLFSAEPSAASQLTPRQLNDFEQHGFVVGPSVLNADQLEALRTELVELTVNVSPTPLNSKEIVRTARPSLQFVICSNILGTKFCAA